MPDDQPIIIAYHLIWTAHGWWLPNDPRGSMSAAIACDVLAELGALHYGRKWGHNWSFVKPYDGWPLHAGHSENSPYVSRLKEH